MYTDEKRDQVLAMLKANGGHVQNTCEAAGIRRSTFYSWIKQHPDFAESVTEIVEGAIDNVESAIYRDALSGNTTAQMYFLNNRARHRGYGKQGLLAGDGGTVKRVIILEMPDNQMFTDMAPEMLELEPGESSTEKNG